MVGDLGVNSVMSFENKMLSKHQTLGDNEPVSFYSWPKFEYYRPTYISKDLFYIKSMTWALYFQDCQSLKQKNF